jgi:tetratricopeptide (TPR) repeat protein
MAKKTRQVRRKKHVPAPLSQFDTYFDLAGYQILQKNYDEAIATCESLLSYLPQRARQRVDVLDLLGSAHAMLQNFPQSYAAYTQALMLAPEDAIMWFNRGMASRFTSRFGKSQCDYERALQLNTNPQLCKKMEQELALARDLAEKSRKLRGPNFTLAQLVEQEDFFQEGMILMEDGKWQEAEQNFRAAIAMSDCLPQPWGNIGLSLIMQKRYDEAEAALQRALAIDPHYTLAKENLRTLPSIRRTGIIPQIDVHDPFRSSKLKQSITFLHG